MPSEMTEHTHTQTVECSVMQKQFPENKFGFDFMFNPHYDMNRKNLKSSTTLVRTLWV